MIRHTLLALLLPLACTAAVPELINTGNAFGFAGEADHNGSVTATLVPAPGAPGMDSLKLVYRLDKRAKNDWMDCHYNPAPPLDLSASTTVRIWMRAEQPGIPLVAKLVDPDNPGPNHSAFEGPLLIDGNPPAPGKWHAFDIPLPADKARRDGLTYLDFYISCDSTDMPLHKDVVFYVGRFTYHPPPRPPWPPKRRIAQSNLTQVWSGPFTAAGPWTLVSGKDNQTDHTARFVNGGVDFNANANGWNEFLWSNPGSLVLAPKTTYRLQYDYSIRQQATGPSDATFYSLVRAKGTIKKDVGWQRWNDPAGSRGRRTVTFTTLDMPDYYLVFGVRHHGSIRIDHLHLWKVEEK